MINIQKKGLVKPEGMPRAPSGMGTKEDSLRPDPFAQQIKEQTDRLKIGENGTLGLKPAKKVKTDKALMGPD